MSIQYLVDDYESQSTPTPTSITIFGDLDGQQNVQCTTVKSSKQNMITKSQIQKSKSKNVSKRSMKMFNSKLGIGKVKSKSNFSRKKDLVVVKLGNKNPTCCSCCCKYCCCCCQRPLPLLLIGLLSTLVGYYCLIKLPPKFESFLDSQRILKPSNQDVWKQWTDMTLPMYVRFYLFNYTNINDIAYGRTPVVNQIGPYTYRINFKKRGLKMTSNETVSFVQHRTFYFDPELSIGPEESELYMINAPMAIAYLKMDNSFVNQLGGWVVDTMNEKIFYKKSVRVWLFDGFESSLIKMGAMQDPSMKRFNGIFRWLDNFNDTNQGEFNIFNGEGSLDKLNRIESWNNMSVLNVWPEDSQCNRIKYSTDGQIIVLNEDKTYNMFLPDLCRVIRFVPKKRFESYKPKELITKMSYGYKFNYPIWRYTFHDDVFSSPDDYPQNQCYTSSLNKKLITSNEYQTNFFYFKNNEPIFHSGVFDLSKCMFDAPLLISKPHFLHAHPSYRSDIIGLEPDPDKHDFEVYLINRLGVPVAVYARIQVNIIVTNIPKLTHYSQMKPGVYPVLWQEVVMEQPEDALKLYHMILTLPFLLINIVSYTLILIGFILVGLSAYRFYYRDSSAFEFKKKRKPISKTNIRL